LPVDIIYPHYEKYLAGDSAPTDCLNGPQIESAKTTSLRVGSNGLGESTKYLYGSGVPLPVLMGRGVDDWP
jgi:hypothetical protein